MGEPTNLISEHRRRFQTTLGRVIEEAIDIKTRITSLEGRVSSLNVFIASVNRLIDRLERRLDLVDQPH